jgi:uncharacterized protein with PIN domain
MIAIDTSAITAIVFNEPERFSYALAKVRGLPLLYKGNDFAETDLRPVVPNLPEPPPRL